MFCWIEKVACSNFNKVLNVVAGKPERNARFETLYSGENHAGKFFNPNIEPVHSVTERGVEAILKNDTWHKAVFYRHPLHRFISSYKSQCTDNVMRPRHCHDTFHFQRKPTFREVVDYTATQRGYTFGSAHWRKQSEFCGGLEGSLQYYQTKEYLDPSRPELAHGQVMGMLASAGIPITDAVTAVIDEAFPKDLSSPEQRAEHERFETSGWHKTVKSSVTTSSSETSTDFFRKNGLGGEAMRVVLKHYLDDFLLFGIPLKPHEMRLLRAVTQRDRKRTETRRWADVEAGNTTTSSARAAVDEVVLFDFGEPLAFQVHKPTRKRTRRVPPPPPSPLLRP
jgi:hypothetical protein